MTVSITAAEILAYFARNWNGVANGEGREHTPEQLKACWDAMDPAERVEWEDEALADKIERA